MEANDDEMFEDAAEVDWVQQNKGAALDGASMRSNRNRRHGGLPASQDEVDNENIPAQSSMDVEGDNNNNDAKEDNVDVEFDDNDNNISAANDVVFDENKFFSAPTFPQPLLEEAKSMIYERIHDPLCRLEAEDGPKVFREYRRQRCRTLKADEKEEQRLLQKNLEDLLVRGDPREYQRHLLEIALKKNTIINLGTGTGKTLIALLCIKEKRAMEQDKQTLFLVPSVALAIQHSLTLQSNLPNFKVETAYNARRGSDRAGLLACEIIVATHGAVSLCCSAKRC